MYRCRYIYLSIHIDIHMGDVQCELQHISPHFFVSNFVHSNCLQCHMLAHNCLAVFGTGHYQYRRRYM